MDLRKVECEDIGKLKLTQDWGPNTSVTVTNLRLPSSLKFMTERIPIHFSNHALHPEVSFILLHVSRPLKC
jgi:hypothetical protein